MPDNKEKLPIQELDAQILLAKKKRQNPLDEESEKNSGKGGPLGLAFRVSVEIVSAVAIGTVIGLLIDNWLGTRPWVMLLFIVLGSAAGMLNVYRVGSGFGYAVGYRQKKDEQKQQEL